MRSQLRQKMQELKLPLEEPYVVATANYLNLLFSNSLSCKEYWSTSLRELIQPKISIERPNDLNLQRFTSTTSSSSRPMSAGRRERLQGLKLSRSVMTYLTGTGDTSKFFPEDILDLGERI